MHQGGLVARSLRLGLHLVCIQQLLHLTCGGEHQGCVQSVHNGWGAVISYDDRSGEDAGSNMTMPISMHPNPVSLVLVLLSRAHPPTSQPNNPSTALPLPCVCFHCTSATTEARPAAAHQGAACLSASSAPAGWPQDGAAGRAHSAGQCRSSARTHAHRGQSTAWGQGWERRRELGSETIIASCGMMRAWQADALEAKPCCQNCARGDLNQRRRRQPRTWGHSVNS